MIALHNNLYSCNDESQHIVHKPWDQFELLLVCDQPCFTAFYLIIPPWELWLNHSISALLREPPDDCCSLIRVQDGSLYITYIPLSISSFSFVIAQHCILSLKSTKKLIIYRLDLSRLVIVSPSIIYIFIVIFILLKKTTIKSPRELFN